MVKKTKIKKNIKKINKIIFLDIDGVLYTTQHHNYLSLKNEKVRDKSGFIFDPESIKNFNKIIDETNAKIVITSTWRRSGLESMKKLFKMRGLKGEIIDITPISTLNDLYFCRGEEIEYWLTYNGISEKFVVLDDNSLGENYDKWKGFFQTKMENGITEEIKNKVINYLNEK